MDDSKQQMGKLVFVRHHESEYNKLGKWTGRVDSHLTPYGVEKAEEMGKLVGDICFNYAFTSEQIRTIQTFTSFLKNCMADQNLPVENAAALNERDYGDYTGLNKWEVKEKIGDEEFTKIRRGWNQ